MKPSFFAQSCVGLALLIQLATSAMAQVAATITVGSTVTDSLMTTSATSIRRPGSYSAFYSFQGTAGQTVAISLSSAQFDTYLYLAGPSGTLVGENDDNGASSDSRIPVGSGLFNLPVTGAYTIEATTYSTNTFGAYALALSGQCVTPPLNVVRFDTLDYITDPDPNGIRLLAGQMSSARLPPTGTGVQPLPLPAFSDQKFCGAIDIAPGVRAEVFVPTAAERAGNYSQSGLVLWDPLTRRTLADGTVVMDPFPGSIVPMSRLQPGGLFAWRILSMAQVAPVTLSLNRTALTFAATANGTAISPPQEVLLGMVGPSNNWTAVSNSTWLGLTPAAGQGTGTFTVSIVPSALPAPGTYSGKITVNASGATNGPLVVNCTLTVRSATTAPFGSFDTPIDNTTGITGSIAVTGWALDDIGVKQVAIWRDPVGPEPVHPNGYVYIGDALFVAGARPDVESKFPNNPRAYRAGWGYMMLTYGLPAKGNGTYRIHAIATDEEGNQIKLGTKTITVDNLRAVKPFGALDAPGPGQTTSGIFINNGWALTPQPASIATNGSTIWVNMNGVNVAHPLYGIGRADVSAFLPGYANSIAAGGEYTLDTTRYSNGMHAIAWVVYDNQGRVDGMGSRYFYIQNAATAASADPIVQAERTLQLRTARLQRPIARAASYPAFRQGYDPDAVLTPIRQAGEGLLEPIELRELDRLELHLSGGQQWTAALRVGDDLRELPIGSTFDDEGGLFYWQLGPAFLGDYLLEFRAADGTVRRIPVQVGPRGATTAAQSAPLQ